jgi:DNA-binding response OmpR family regulator
MSDEAKDALGNYLAKRHDEDEALFIKEVKSEKLKVKSLELDTNTFDVRKDGKSIELSRKEFALLEYLMRNSGKVVSKENIIAHVWDYESDILPNTVEVFIGYLRDKIGGDTIKTVRGFGYKIE